MVEFFHVVALRHGAHDHTEVVGLDGSNEPLQTGTLAAIGDFLGKVDAVGKRHQHDVTTRNGNIARQPRPLGGNGFLHDLYQNRLIAFQYFVDFALFLNLGFQLEFADVAGIGPLGNDILSELVE